LVVLFAFGFQAQRSALDEKLFEEGKPIIGNNHVPASAPVFEYQHHGESASPTGAMANTGSVSVSDAGKFVLLARVVSTL
jgi:hypothetical protein